MNGNEFAKQGSVSIVGAGPGDAGLLTARARDAIFEAHVLLTDRLALHAARRELRNTDQIVDLWPEGCASPEIIDVGKEAGGEGWTQEEINREMIERARAGQRVVRLKGGDPFLFGRGAEEAAACHAAGIPCEVVPGLSSAFAAPALAGIPVTLRGIAADVHVMTGHLGATPGDEEQRWRDAAKFPGTLVILMGVGVLRRICANLLSGGKPPDTPAAVIERASLPSQRVTVITLGELTTECERVGVGAPAVIVVGEVVSHRVALEPIAKGPLKGRRFAVTGGDSMMSLILENRGGRCERFPLFSYHPIPHSDDERTALLDQVRSADFLLFTSSRAVHALNQFLHPRRLELRLRPSATVICVGENTAVNVRTVLELAADAVAPNGVCDLASLDIDWKGKRVLWLRGREVRQVTREILAERGAVLEEHILYERRPIPENRDAFHRALQAGEIDVAVWLSGGGVREGLGTLPSGVSPNGVIHAAIGETTAAILEEHGAKAAIVPDRPDPIALANAIIAHFRDAESNS